MKLALPLVLSAATIASSLALPPAPELQSDLPNSRFKIILHFDSPFLPINPTLASIIYFMSEVARSDFKQQILPRKYSSPMYPQIEITCHTPIEARFLLWGIYLAATDMVKYTRFNNVVINLSWDNTLVGQISLLVNTSVTLPGTVLLNSEDTKDHDGKLNRHGISNKTTQTLVKRLQVKDATTNAPARGNMSLPNSVKTLSLASSIMSSSTSPIPPVAPLASRFAIEFEWVAGAARIKRNDVFLSFYTAMLHVAKFPVRERLQYFNSQCPTVDLRVHMYDSGNGCLVILLTSLIPTLVWT